MSTATTAAIELAMTTILEKVKVNSTPSIDLQLSQAAANLASALSYMENK